MSTVWVDPAALVRLPEARTVEALKTAFLNILRPLGYGAFDAWSVRADTVDAPLVRGNFAVTSYDIGLVRRYVSERIIDECSALAESGVSHVPFDYLNHLAARPDDHSAVWQLRLLKVFGVRHAWLVPLSSVNQFQGVTCYMGRGERSGEAHFRATRDIIHVVSTYFFDTLIKLEPPLPDGVLMDGEEPLSVREQAVVAAAGDGQTNAAIAATLGISENTVRFHFKNVFRKLGVRTRAQAVKKAGLLPTRNT